MFALIKAADWPIWPLIICSIIALALVIERFVSLKTSNVSPPQLLDEAMSISASGVPSQEVVRNLEESSVLGSVLASGLRALISNPRSSEGDLRAAMEGAGRTAAMRLEKYLGALSTIASVSPLLGLMGTVIGMIKIFGAQVGAGGLATGNPTEMASGISIALYNTAFGLMVAIPSLLFWRYFRARVDAYLLTLELAGERFVRHISRLRKT